MLLQSDTVGSIPSAVYIDYWLNNIFIKIY